MSTCRPEPPDQTRSRHQLLRRAVRFPDDRQYPAHGWGTVCGVAHGAESGRDQRGARVLPGVACELERQAVLRRSDPRSGQGARVAQIELRRAEESIDDREELRGLLVTRVVPYARDGDD